MRPARLNCRKIRYCPGFGNPYGIDIVDAIFSAGISIPAIDDDPGVSALAIIIEAIDADPEGWMCAKTLRSSRMISACAAIPM